MDKYERAIDRWRNQSLLTEGDYANALAEFEILFSYHSGHLDNEGVTFSDTRDIFLEGTVSDYSGPVSTLREIWNYKRGCELLRNRLCEGRPMSVDLCCDLFETLAQGMEDAELERPLPDDKDRLRDVLEEVGAYTGDRILKAGTYLHAAINYLGTFGHYSACISRMLLNYYLMSRNHPPIVIYSFDGDIYRDCLTRFSELEELGPLYKFFQYETEKLWSKSEKMFENAV